MEGNYNDPNKKSQSTTTMTTPTTTTTTTTSQQPHRSSFGAASISRSSLTIFFLATCSLYILYSSNLIFLSHQHHHHHQLQHQQQLQQQEIISSPLCVTSSKSLDLQLLANLTSEEDKEEEEEEEEEESPSPELPRRNNRQDTELKHVVFAVAASAGLWEKRKEYIKAWWRPGKTRGVVWLDRPVRVRKGGEGLPIIKVSGDTSRFKYTNKQGRRAALRISRIVTETLKLGLKDVRWFVMGDDDTVFFTENLIRVLAKYDHRQFYYVGSSSESHVQNIYFSYGMAYGGGGFAISYPLAVELSKMQDRCMQRYPALYGSDDRMHACMAELGVPLTREPGFHQYDVYGDLVGLLGAHPVAPLLSLHHIDVVEPVFPSTSRLESIRRLLKWAHHDTPSIMQQSMCYDESRRWSVSVSWGYVVQIVRGAVSPRELEMPTRTFLNWYPRADYTAYSFNTRPLAKHPCQKPFYFFANDVGRRRSFYSADRRRSRRPPYCRWNMDSPEEIRSVVVFKKPDPQRWLRAPRRDCCRVLPSTNSSVMNLWVGNCRAGEISQLF